MRVAFLVSTLVLLGLAVLATAESVGVISAAEHLAYLQPLREFVNSVQATVGALATLVGRLVPPISGTWLYLGLAGIGALYATLFGIGATAYRFIWQRR